VRFVEAGGVFVQGARVVSVVHDEAGPGDGGAPGVGVAAGGPPAVDAESALQPAVASGEAAAVAQTPRGAAGAGRVALAATGSAPSWGAGRLQLTPHLHLLVPEALWRADGEVVVVGPPEDDEVQAVLERVLGQAQRDWQAEGNTWADDEYEELQQHALQQQRLALEEGPRHRRRRVAVAHGFSLHADTAAHGNDRQSLERLCRYGARGPMSECRLRRLDDGRYEYTPRKGGAFTLTAEALVRRLVALVPPARLHLTSFHGVYAPNAALRPLVTLAPAEVAVPVKPGPRAKVPAQKKRRLDWATLHQRTFGTDVLRCPCGGRRTIRALHATRKAAEERLLELRAVLASRVLPPATAPPQAALAL
jgi:Putative transposase